MQVVRTFIAIEFSTAVHQQLQAIITDLQHNLQDHKIPACLRWVAAKNIHLTLRFLGETTPLQSQRLTSGLCAATSDHPPFALTIGGLGGFPNLRQPRVLWLSVGGDLPQLTALQTKVEAAVQVAGFAAEERPFSAHVTLARAQRNATKVQLRRVGELLREQRTIPQIPVHIDSIVHMQSDLRAGGAVYRPLAQFGLNRNFGSKPI